MAACSSLERRGITQSSAGRYFIFADRLQRPVHSRGIVAGISMHNKRAVSPAPWLTLLASFLRVEKGGVLAPSTVQGDSAASFPHLAELPQLQTVQRTLFFLLFPTRVSCLFRLWTFFSSSGRRAHNEMRERDQATSLAEPRGEPSDSNERKSDLHAVFRETERKRGIKTETERERELFFERTFDRSLGARPPSRYTPRASFHGNSFAARYVTPPFPLPDSCSCSTPSVAT